MLLKAAGCKKVASELHSLAAVLGADVYSYAPDEDKMVKESWVPLGAPDAGEWEGGKAEISKCNGPWLSARDV